MRQPFLVSSPTAFLLAIICLFSMAPVIAMPQMPNASLSTVLSDTLDHDADGVVDLLDLDADNDGIINRHENLQAFEYQLLSTRNLNKLSCSEGTPFITTVASGNWNWSLGSYENQVGIDGMPHIIQFDRPVSGLSVFVESLPRNFRLQNFSLMLADGSVIDNVDFSVHDAGEMSTYEVSASGYASNNNHTNSVLAKTNNRGLHAVELPVGSAEQGYAMLRFNPEWRVKQLSLIAERKGSFRKNSFGFRVFGQPEAYACDTDKDGLYDFLDLDADNDGIPDTMEAQPLMAYRSPLGADLDGNGLDDAFESTPGAGGGLKLFDTDADGRPDMLEWDSDGDGISDLAESGSGYADADQDGMTDVGVGANGLDDRLEHVDDFTDPDGMFEGLSGMILADSDSDGVPDFRDVTQDWQAPVIEVNENPTGTETVPSGEGVAFSLRWHAEDSRYHLFMQPTATPLPDVSMTAQVTIRVPHATGTERFQLSGLSSAVTGMTWSANSRVDAPVEAPHLDYVSFSLTPMDVAAFQWQAGQEVEVFSFANAGSCLGPVSLLENETDPFNLPLLQGGSNSAGTNPGNQFSNLGWNLADSSANNYIGNYGSAADCSSGADQDGDGISDYLEQLIGSDPTNADSDGDGGPDNFEVGSDTNSPWDTDGDGIPDLVDTDDDGDSLLTVFENYNGGSPMDDDSDADGVADYQDNDDDGDGYPTIDEFVDANGDGNPADSMDNDGDGIPDYLDANDLALLSLHLRVLLQGPYNMEDALMRDDLRQLGVIPLNQPFADETESLGYTGTEQIAAELLAVEGNDAIVDWVLVELRNPLDREGRMAAKAALLQRDGDVVDAQTGLEVLDFQGVAAGDYYIALNHRNHLGLVSLDQVPLASTPVLVDFTDPDFPVFGDDGRLLTEGLALMWAGEADTSNSVVCVGPGNDLGVMLSGILTAEGNKQFNSNYRLPGYYKGDFNLDGYTLFAGPGNDSNLAVGNVLLHPGNQTFSANFVVPGRRPKHKDMPDRVKDRLDRTKAKDKWDSLKGRR